MATQIFPHRDAQGRVVSLLELVAAAVVGAVISLAALLLIDGLIALIGLGEFGTASGWLAVILPGMLFFDELRAWRGSWARIPVAVVAALVALGLGTVAASVTRDLSPIVSGAVGAVVAVCLYSFLWFVGIRWLSGHRTEME